MSRFVICLFFFGGFLYAKPMESIERYNIILVHGAYGSEKGIADDLCENAPEASFAPETL